MKNKVIVNKGISMSIDLETKITNRINIFVNDSCEYGTCKTSHRVFVIDLSGYEKIDFLEHSTNIGSPNHKEFIEKKW